MHSIAVLLMATLLKGWYSGVCYQVPSSGTALFLTSGGVDRICFSCGCFPSFCLFRAEFLTLNFIFCWTGRPRFLPRVGVARIYFQCDRFLSCLPVLSCFLHPISYFMDILSLFSQENTCTEYKIPGTAACSLAISNQKMYVSLL